MRHISSLLPDWVTGGKETGAAGVVVPADTGLSCPRSKLTSTHLTAVPRHGAQAAK